jgi:glucose/arabinose dehydrogenase/cytochrome c551/c552
MKERLRLYHACLALLLLAGSGLVQAQPEAPSLGPGPWFFDSFEQAGLQLSVLARGLDHPFSLVFVPGTQSADDALGDILINERSGRIRLYRKGELQAAAVADLAATFPLQQLFDIELHPRFAENRLVYFSWIKQLPHPDGSARLWATTALARGRWNGSSFEALEELFEAQAWSDNICGASSRLHFLADGTLLLGVSHRCDLEGPQRLDTHIGKVLRLNDDGSVPRDNPFVAHAAALPEIYTWGNRSVMDFSTQPQSAAIWELENGAQGGDEVNVLQPGANYGWPLATFGRDYDGRRFGPQPWVEGTELPALYWVPSITVSSLLFYTGERFPAWKNQLFVTGMLMGRVPGTGQLQRIVFNELGEQRREVLLESLRQRFRQIVQGPDDLLYLLTDHSDGVLLQLAPAGQGAQLADPAAAAAAAAAVTGSAAAEAAPELLVFAGQDCAACHRSEQRLLGPSWREIAQRYQRSEAVLALLAARIRTGSEGSWGEAPMSAHPELSEAEARDMVSRILELAE